MLKIINGSYICLVIYIYDAAIVKVKVYPITGPESP
jgi:hypothetical protein